MQMYVQTDFLKAGKIYLGGVVSRRYIRQGLNICTSVCMHARTYVNIVSERTSQLLHQDQQDGEIMYRISLV